MAKKRKIIIKRMVRISPITADPRNGNKPFVARFKKISSTKKPHKKSYKIRKRKRGIFNKSFRTPIRKSLRTPMRKSLF